MPMTPLIAVLTVISLGFGGSLRAAEPFFVLRAEGGHQGIIRFDESGHSSALASFVYKTDLWPEGRISLAATAERLILQGSAYTEFDARNGHFLRRYRALGPSFGSWAFTGYLMTAEQAKRFGLAPGTYGVPVCPTSSSVTGGLCAGGAGFPSYENGAINQQVVLRRPLDPADTALSVARVLAPPGFLVRRRFTGFDPTAGTFRFLLAGSNMTGFLGVERITRANVHDGVIGDETTVRETILGSNSPAALYRTPETFSFDNGTGADYIGYYHFGDFSSLLVRQTDTSEEALMRGSRADLLINGTAELARDLPPTYTQLVPAVAAAPGANGTNWHSDVWLYNPSDAATAATIRLVSDPTIQKSIQLEPRASVALMDVVTLMQGRSTIDALLVDSPYRENAQLSIYSRTYTTGSGGGTYGEAVPAVPTAIGYSNHLDVLYTGDVAESDTILILDKRNPAQFRHNLGVVNTSDEPIRFTLRYAIVSANPPLDPRREATFTAPPHAVKVVNIESMFPAEMVESDPPRIQILGERPASLWLSMVDNITGDASFVPFSIYSIIAPPGARLAVPGVAHTAGANGTVWRTDMYGFFPATEDGEEAQTPTAEVYKNGVRCDGAARLSAAAGVANYTGHPFFLTQFNDVAAQFCTGDTVGALTVATASWTAGWTRTYTTRPDGGTFGEMLPFFPPTGWPSRHFAGIVFAADRRVNLGLYNGSATQTVLDLALYRADGALVARRQMPLAAQNVQQVSLRDLFNASDGVYALSVVSTDGRGCWAYVSTVDNTTGDPANWW